MLDTDSVVHSIASEMTSKADSTEVSPSEVADTESMEAEGEATNEEVEVSADQDDIQSETTTEEDASAPAQTEEEPKLTLKQFQEIDAKSKELEAKEAAFTERMQAQEKEFQTKYHEKLQVHDQFDDFLANLANKDPELFDILKGEFAEHQKQFTNPVYQSLQSEMAELKKELGTFKNTASDKVTLNNLETEMTKFNAGLGKEALAAGLKIDNKAIEDLWAKGLTVEQAFYANYGAAYSTAKASKEKLATVAKKVEARPSVSTAGSIGRSTTPAKTDAPKDAFGAVQHFAQKLAGYKA